MQVTRFKSLHLGRGDEIGSALVKMYGDFLFKTPTFLLAEALSRDPKAPVYLYHYTHQGPLSLYDCLTLPPFQFLFKLFGLRFWLDWLWENTMFAWICRWDKMQSGYTGIGNYTLLLLHQGPMMVCATQTSCSCCSRLTKCPSPWCALRLTRG